MENETIEKFMRIALREAEKAKVQNEVPVGAVIIDNDNQIISKAHNQIESSYFVGSHAEMIAIKLASEKINNWRLTNCKLFVTMEPCIMCSGALVLSRISNIYFGCYDQRMGGATSTFNLCDNRKLPHQINIQGGILEEDSKILLQSFFKSIRKS